MCNFALVVAAWMCRFAFACLESGGAFLHLWLLCGGAALHLLVSGWMCNLALVVVAWMCRFTLACLGLEVSSGGAHCKFVVSCLRVDVQSCSCGCGVEVNMFTCLFWGGGQLWLLGQALLGLGTFCAAMEQHPAAGGSPVEEEVTHYFPCLWVYVA